MASLEAEASALSSVASSQDSLHKQPKKKGIKSSIGRLFGKKEKGRLAHLAHRQVMVDPQGECCFHNCWYVIVADILVNLVILSSKWKVLEKQEL